ALKKTGDRDEPAWLCCGNLFINFTQQQANYLLEKDQKSYDEQISKLNQGLKAKVNKLYEAENKPELKGYDLIPINKEEKQSLFDLVEKD
ncbi:p53 and DNA damage-regulated 1, partial [Brachionus plicatilis]